MSPTQLPIARARAPRPSVDASRTRPPIEQLKSILRAHSPGDVASSSQTPMANTSPKAQLGYSPSQIKRLSDPGPIPIPNRLERPKRRFASVPSTVEELPEGLSNILAQLHEISKMVPGGAATIDDNVDMNRMIEIHNQSAVITSERGKAGSVFGVSLPQSLSCASCAVVLGGQKLYLPLVIFTTIEELYATGLDDPRLFQVPSNPGRLSALVRTFDSAPDYGDNYSFDGEATSNVCGLFFVFLQSLPSPVLDGCLFDALANFCVAPSLSSTSKAGISPILRVKIAQMLIRLLPPANFNLIVYVVAFLSHIPQSPKNSLDHKTVAKLFGQTLIAKGSSPSTTREKCTPDDILLWLLEHWDALSDGLFVAESDPGVGLGWQVGRKPGFDTEHDTDAQAFARKIRKDDQDSKRNQTGSILRKESKGKGKAIQAWEEAPRAVESQHCPRMNRESENLPNIDQSRVFEKKVQEQDEQIKIQADRIEELSAALRYASRRLSTLEDAKDSQSPPVAPAEPEVAQTKPDVVQTKPLAIKPKTGVPNKGEESASIEAQLDKALTILRSVQKSITGDTGNAVQVPMSLTN
ncbi:Rho GTPase activation protein [Sistotremastrum niveocremeum HHB9708]|uniref:Rho GTPase activation protein n=1 Tax=Sistotremastrum niveocremeum HHB9708 TaxID=1314777 RepID=A0A164UME0_9AGAM|nr:Rho GTPase activation protein [Sistotremastrum niveocremeum HHB9708]